MAALENVAVCHFTQVHKDGLEIWSASGSDKLDRCVTGRKKHPVHHAATAGHTALGWCVPAFRVGLLWQASASLMPVEHNQGACVLMEGF